MNINITVDSADVRRQLGELAKQGPFAAANALNRVTNDAQDAILKGYAERFTLRRPDFFRREGAKRTHRATKTEQYTILEVTPKAGFLGKFEDGGDKRPIEGKAIAVPLAVRRNKADIIPLSQRPPALYASKGAAKGRIFSMQGKLWQVVGVGKRAVIRSLYAWRSVVRVKPLLRFVRTANEAVDAKWVQRATEAVADAIRTAFP